MLRSVPATWIFILGSVISLGSFGQRTPLPFQGIVPNEQTAVAIAKAIFVPVFGEEHVSEFNPYHAQLKDGVWTVYGTLKPGSRGGTPQLEIQKKDGRVLEVWHSQ